MLNIQHYSKPVVVRETDGWYVSTSGDSEGPIFEPHAYATKKMALDVGKSIIDSIRQYNNQPLCDAPHLDSY